MPQRKRQDIATEKLSGELRRGSLVLATLSQLETPRYGYALLERLSRLGLEIEQGTLYPLLRRLDEQGLLESEWQVEGSRPRKYYRLNDAGARVLGELTESWSTLVDVMAGLLAGDQGESRDESD